jgi:hypothetical protein
VLAAAGQQLVLAEVLARRTDVAGRFRLEPAPFAEPGGIPARARLDDREVRRTLVARPWGAARVLVAPRAPRLRTAPAVSGCGSSSATHRGLTCVCS